MAHEDVVYFAYDSNMDTNRLRERISNFTLLGTGTLKGYRLAFTRPSRSHRFSYADLLPSPNHCIKGIVYRVSYEAMKVLDKYEMLSVGDYWRTQETVEMESGTQRVTLYRGARQSSDLKPAPQYLKHMIKGAYEHCLPEEYINTLKAVETTGGYLYHPDTVFVYGLLKEGSSRAEEIIGKNRLSSFKGKARGKLYCLGDYPGMTETEEESFVQGEILRLTHPNQVLAAMDDFEGVAEDEANVGSYARKLIDAEGQDGSHHLCWVYLFSGKTDESQLIESGCWEGGERR
jgi:gamma-glutamylcyclotransferase (GGCT)/AIG2-like uncharacterized protein YtfP